MASTLGWSGVIPTFVADESLHSGQLPNGHFRKIVSSIQMGTVDTCVVTALAVVVHKHDVTLCPDRKSFLS